MQEKSPLFLYRQLLAGEDYQADAVQAAAIEQLDQLYHQLLARRAETSAAADAGGLLGRLGKKLLGKPIVERRPPLRGLYMWGGVGRGKTWLMDLFYRSLPEERKLRLHFHRFMLRVHEEMISLQGHQDPLEEIADGISAQTDVLCFDEFYVSDITDAMLLGTLIQGLFARGITLVATSNIPPDELYRNGLQRARFLPVIAAINHFCDVVNIDAGIDYRLRALTRANLYLTPDNPASEAALRRIFTRLAGREPRQAPVLTINHRPLPTLGAENGVVALDFSALCAEARSQNDYIALARLFHSVLLHHVRSMGKDDENTARRFVALVDEFYERRVKLVIAADAPLEELYRGSLLQFEFRRCLSRLQEMQSQDYLSQPHQP